MHLIFPYHFIKCDLNPNFWKTTFDEWLNVTVQKSEFNGYVISFYCGSNFIATRDAGSHMEINKIFLDQIKGFKESLNLPY